MNIWLDTALDELHGPLSDWVYSGTSSAKRDLFMAYAGLPAQAKAALAQAIRKAFGGASSVVMYRRMKSPGEIARMGGASLTTELPGYVEAESFEVTPDEVLVHHAIPNTPLNSKAFGHEREVILKPDASPKYLGPVPSRLAYRLAARYKDKKQVPKADGKGKTTVYEYSDRQVALRNREKAKQVEKLRKSIGDLREQVRKDLKSKDEHTRNVALAVGLLDKTYERIGNEGSAKDGHVGVTGWKVKHLTVGKGKVTIKYVGKSGVKHEKVIDNATSVAAIKKAIEGKDDDDLVCGCNADDVNEYLKPFDVTAKDLRGYHANTEMQTRLRRIRSESGALPKNREERKGQLKEEFDQALEETAEAVGHEPSTLRSQYLVPGLEDEFMKGGEVSQTLDKRGSSVKVEFSGYERRVRSQTRDLAESKIEELDNPPDFDKIVRDVRLLLGEDFARRLQEGDPKSVSSVSSKALELYKVEFRREYRRLVQDLSDLRDAWDPSNTPEGIRASYARSADSLIRASSENLSRFAQRLSEAVGRISSWSGSSVVVSPLSEGSFDPVTDFEVSVGRRGAGFTVFASESPLEIGDQLEAGDDDFFDDLSEQADYFNLVKELVSPGSSSRGKSLILYTARPLRDRSRYENARTLPVGIFLTTDPDDALGIAHDLGGSEDRDVWRVVVNEAYLVNTLDRGRTKHYQVVGLGPAPVRSIDLFQEGRPRTAAAQLEELWFGRTATKSQGEKENEEVERLVKPAPKTKPPRQDLRRNRMKVEDKDVEQPNAENDRDLSLNYKKVAADLIARWYGVIPPRPKPPKPPSLPPRDPIPGWSPVTLELSEKRSRKPGDVWRSKTQGRWLAKNQEGVVHSFDDKVKAEAYAGKTKIASNDLWFLFRDAKSSPPSSSIPAKERKPGEVWESTRTKGRWMGKNQEGSTKSFDSKGQAKSFAEGGELPEDGDLEPGTPSEPKKKPPRKKETPTYEAREAEYRKMVDTLSALGKDQLESVLSDLSLDERDKLVDEFNRTTKSVKRAFGKDLTKTPSQKVLEGLGGSFENPTAGFGPVELGRRLAEAVFVKTVLADPGKVGSPVSRIPLSPDETSKRRAETLKLYNQMPPSIRKEAIKNLYAQMTGIPEDGSDKSASMKADLQSRLVGLAVASAYNDEPCSVEVESEWGKEEKEIHPPIPPATVKLLKALGKSGKAHLALDAVAARGTPEGRAAFVNAIGSLTDKEFTELAEGMGFSSVVDTMKGEDTSPLAKMNTEALLQSLVVNQLMFGDLLTENALDESGETNPKKRKNKSDKVKPEMSPETRRRVTRLNDCIKQKGFTAECGQLTRDVENSSLDDLFKDILRDIGKVPKGSAAKAQMEAYQRAKSDQERKDVLEALFVQTSDIPPGAKTKSNPGKTAYSY